MECCTSNVVEAGAIACFALPFLPTPPPSIQINMAHKCFELSSYSAYDHKLGFCRERLMCFFMGGLVGSYGLFSLVLFSQRQTGRDPDALCPSIARLILLACWGTVFFMRIADFYFLTNFFNTFWPERKKCSKSALGAAQKCYRTAKLADRMQNSTAMQSQTCIRFDRSLLCCAKRIFVQMRLVCPKPSFSITIPVWEGLRKE